MKIKQILMFLLILPAVAAAGAQDDDEPRTPHTVIAQDVADKLLLRRVEPIYPEDAKGMHIAGQVVVWMVIDKEGNVAQAIPVAKDLANRKSINADDMRIRASAAIAVKQWKYRPYRMPGGELVEVGTSVVLKFDFTGEQKPSSAVPPPTRTHLEPGLAAANKIHDVAPAYPQMARIAHIQGDVLVSAIIGKHGEVENLRPISGHPILIQAALDAVKQWKYTPFMFNGEPVEVETVIKVTFQM